MGRKVKCRVTGDYGDSDIFYKADNGLWYKSKEVYEEYKSEAEYRRKIIDFFCLELLGYQEGCTFPTILAKKLATLSAYSNKTIWATILYKEDDLRYWASVEDKFKNDFGKICYLFVIIVNHINEVQKKIKAQKQTEKKIDKKIESVELPTETIVQNIGTKRAAKDISKFLED